MMRKDRLIAQMEAFVAKNALFEKDTPLLVAVSGGVDSMVLCDLLLAQGYHFGIAHCNFGLRGAESDQDQIWMEKYALQHQIPFFCKKFDTLGLIQLRKNNFQKETSIQVVARQLRYQFFLEILEKEKYQCLLTAHHQNDVFESVLLNLAKGTSIAGLRGILPKRPYPFSLQKKTDKKYDLVRPLLFTKKDDILAYAKKYNLSWREDSSNPNPKYKRNLIRHQITPLLESVHSDAVRKFAESASRIQEIERLFLHHYRHFIKKYVRKLPYLGSFALQMQYQGLKKSPAPTHLLYQILKNKGFSYPTCQNIAEKIKYSQIPLRNSLRFESKKYTFLLDKEAMFLYPKTGKARLFVLEKIETKIPFFEKNINLKVVASEKLYTDVFPAPDASIALFDAEKISFPLQLRLWQAGDSFAPLGMKGKHKKVSDILNDLKLSTFEKNNTWVLISKGEIVWVVGKRISELHKVLPTTQKILQVWIETKSDKMF